MRKVLICSIWFRGKLTRFVDSAFVLKPHVKHLNSLTEWVLSSNIFSLVSNLSFTFNISVSSNTWLFSSKHTHRIRTYPCRMSIARAIEQKPSRIVLDTPSKSIKISWKSTSVFRYFKSQFVFILFKRKNTRRHLLNLLTLI